MGGMSVTVYQMAHSPFCIPITTALGACGVAHETREVPNWDRSEVIKLTGGAYYQVPVLEHDGRLVFETAPDSQEVARYVDRTFAAGRLFPAAAEGLQMLLVPHLEDEVEARTFKLVDPRYVDGIGDLVDRTMLIRHKERRFGRGCIEQWRRDAGAIRAEADRLLQPYELTLQHSPFLLGAEPVYADFLLYGILANLTWNGWNTLSTAQTQLQRWMESVRAWRW